MAITPGTLHRGDQVRHLVADPIRETRGTVLACFEDLQGHPVAAVQWRGGYLGVSRLKWLGRASIPTGKEKQ